MSDEDEGGSYRADSRKVPLSRELSDLISLHRTRLTETGGLKERGGSESEEGLGRRGGGCERSKVGVGLERWV